MTTKSLSLLPLALAATLALTGCAGFQTTASNPAAASAATFGGSVHGGQQPISNSHIYFYAANTNQYAGPSTSLLNTTGSGVSTDSKGVGYVTSDANGNWSIAGDYTCPSSGAPTYLYAVGGNPGLQPSSVNNTAITFLAMVGDCSSINSTTLVNINEVTTVATITVMQQFMVFASSPLNPTSMGTNASNLAAMTNSANLVANIVDRASGLARATTLAGNGIAPQAKLNALANMFVPCVNSASPTSPICTQFFSSFYPYYPPTDVANAMYNITQEYGAGYSSDVYGPLSFVPANPPFQPTLSSLPNDFALAITYSGGGLTAPGDVVIDASGNAFTANCPRCFGGSGVSSIVGFSPVGAILTGASGFTGGGISLPQRLAFDEEGYLWVADSGLPGVLRFNSSGAQAPGFPVNTVNANPTGIAIDANSDAWVTSPGSATVFEVNNTGSLLNSNTSFVKPTGIGIDGNGSIFVADPGANAIAKLSNTGSSVANYTQGVSSPISIAIDSADEISTVDSANNEVSEIGGQNGGAYTITSPYPYWFKFTSVAMDGGPSGWIAGCGADCPGSGLPAAAYAPDRVVGATSAGQYGVPNGFQDPQFNQVNTAAADKSGNLWVSNSAGGSLTVLLGVATPVVTPLAIGAQNNTVGRRP